MAPSEKLARSLQVLQDLQKTGAAAIRAKDISRTHRERLKENGFLQEVMKGWYIPSRPDEQRGDSTSWYSSYWRFCASYLEDRFGSDWCLSPEQSIKILGGNWTVPRQLLVRSPKAQNNTTTLTHNTSLFDVRTSVPKEAIEIRGGLRIYNLSNALIEASPTIFNGDPIDVRTILSMIRDASDILPGLLDGGHTVIAGRLAGAFRNIGKGRIADEIVKTMRSAGYESQEKDPFEAQLNGVVIGQPASPYVNRLRLMWTAMRESVIQHFPKPPGLPTDKNSYLKQVKDVFTTDAYHSLSIEGYQVTRELIERVAQGSWNPEQSENDREVRNVLAARGYWQAFQEVLKSVGAVLGGENSGKVADNDHGGWYRELFAPSVTAGIIKASDLSGYRNGQVYIRRSMHVPLNRDAVRDAMPEFFDLLKNEEHPAVRVVLGHFIFVYIHPYMDGNGRIARFLTNLMLASGGYPWTVVPLEKRDAYMAALEQASVHQNIVPFVEVLSELVTESMKGTPIAKL